MNHKKTSFDPIHRRGSRSRAGLATRLTLLLLLFPVVVCAQQPRPAPPMSAPGPALLTPLPPPGPKPASHAPTGSLWSESSGSLFKDIKANKIGDILTITVSEESKASKEAVTQTNRDKNLAASMDFAGMGLGASGKANPTGAFSFGPLQGKFANGFNGTGTTSKTDSMTASMTATVVDTMPNGNLIIRGTRWTQVNNEMQQIVLEGIVRPADITRNNTVLSQDIAEAKIFFVGKGPVSQHQKPGWALRLFDLISPF